MNTTTPTHSLEAERAALGCCLCYAPALDDVLPALHHTDFYNQAHRHIYRAICALSDDRCEVDIVTVVEKLSTQGKLKAAGGMAGVSALTTVTPHITSGAVYAGIVKRHSQARQACAIANDIVSGVLDGKTPSEVTTGAIKGLEGILEQVLPDRLQTLSQLMGGFLEALAATAEQEEGKEKQPGLSWGLPALDSAIGRVLPDRFLVIGARPAMGKTALAFQAAAHVARSGAVYAVSLEMGSTDLGYRFAANEARVDINRIAKTPWKLSSHDWNSLTKACASLAPRPLYLDDTPGVNTATLIARARSVDRRARKDGHSEGLALVVVDYLQLIGKSSARQSVEESIAEASRALKLLSKELHCCVLALAQVNRQCENRADKRPLTSDLRGSGAIEQDADAIAFVYRDVVYNLDTVEKHKVELISAKNRHGAPGRYCCAFDGEQVRFY